LGIFGTSGVVVVVATGVWASCPSATDEPGPNEATHKMAIALRKG
jgi:hypothetical protein